MSLQTIWAIFLTEMNSNSIIQLCERKDITGIPFIYITPAVDADLDLLLQTIKICSKKAMYKQRVTVKTNFVRKSDNIYVFRHRFFVPQEKMFCCGNLCEDCIRLKNR
ncbi:MULTISPECIES: hypothetical protein [Sutcliffiella]|uniref:Uncharacterized protein n=1 Tax=Sutcliffiella cohnii TaxID=33932 RepID=A0A223KRQ7_9BACI|nr:MULTISPECIES: hypothetical protein [Sutcliffiella]AST92171.1 hypothetical protein BC6307_13195 [Sutcliffiella cohnii]MED4015458.1 hypothetical protein [Sutcliffiella cohnii]WBL13402.1 hypothetical protein O1A01_15915 [Sutcliffiella sp. NC1]